MAKFKYYVSYINITKESPLDVKQHINKAQGALDMLQPYM